ncbi:hypothetical protein [Streptomyces avermitilis]|uniref:hypothetical protein n=1 Tax=Streptomyces avermitilis TaxID=33903 RepID=UPI0036CC867B
MLALRLARGAHPLVQLRRLLVTAAAAGTGFLLLCTLGYAMAHPDASARSVLRLAWCVAPMAATVYFAVAVARTDPGTRPRPGLSAIGLGPVRLMAVSAVTTALSTTLGSMLALLFFLHLRGDLTGMPFDGAAAEFLAADQPLPLPGALTLLALVPLAASVASALVLRPRGEKQARMSGTSTTAGTSPTIGTPTTARTSPTIGTPLTAGASATIGAPLTADASATAGTPTTAGTTPTADTPPAADTDSTSTAPGTSADSPTPSATPPSTAPSSATPHDFPAEPLDPQRPAVPQPAPGGLPWSVAVLAAGLAVEMYASRSGPAPGLALPGRFADGPAGVLAGWTLTAMGLVLAGPAITYLCGWLLQAVRPGALRLLAGRVLQEEARRIGQPLGVVCAVASGAYATATLYAGARPSFGPLSTLGALLVTGCTVATLVTAAVEAKHARAETTAALLRLGAPATMLRSAALLRAGALVAVFVPLTWAVAELAAMPLTG